MTKSRLRQEMKGRLPSPDDPLRREAARLAAERISRWSIWAERGVILSFLSLPSEIDSRPLNEAAVAAGKVLGFPRIEGSQIVFRRMGLGVESTTVNRFGIREPAESVEHIDLGAGGQVLALVPGLAYTTSGRRLGRGGGYYDRFLPTIPDAVTVGLCFELQIVDELPVVETDVPVQWILTERRLIPAVR